MNALAQLSLKCGQRLVTGLRCDLQHLSRASSQLLYNSSYTSATCSYSNTTRNLTCCTRPNFNITRHSSYFSVTRAILGQSEKEKEKQQGIPNPPPLTIYHARRDIRGQPKKYNNVAALIRGMPIEEAIDQMEFSPKGAAATVKEVLEEAQDIAVNKHGVEDKNNLYVHESFVGRGVHHKTIKYHGRGRHGVMRRYYCHYFLVLKEGPPPDKVVVRKYRDLCELERARVWPKTIKNSLSWF